MFGKGGGQVENLSVKRFLGRGHSFSAPSACRPLTWHCTICNKLGFLPTWPWWGGGEDGMQLAPGVSHCFIEPADASGLASRCYEIPMLLEKDSNKRYFPNNRRRTCHFLYWIQGSRGDLPNPATQHSGHLLISAPHHYQALCPSKDLFIHSIAQAWPSIP